VKLNLQLSCDNNPQKVTLGNESSMSKTCNYKL